MSKARSKIAQSYRDVFEGPQGRIVLGDILTQCCLFDGTAALDPSGRVDPYRMAMKEGARQVAITIAKRMGYTEKEFVKQSNDMQSDLQKFMEHMEMNGDLNVN